MLQAEVAALKQLVLTSTPSAPNKHLHPQICDTSPKKEKGANSKPFWKSHRRSTSHHEFTKEQRQQPEEPQENSCCIKEVNGIGNLVLSKGKIFLVKKCSVHYDQG